MLEIFILLLDQAMIQIIEVSKSNKLWWHTPNFYHTLELWFASKLYALYEALSCGFILIFIYLQDAAK